MTKLNLGRDLYLKGRIGWRGLSKDEYLEHGDYKIINATALMDGYVDWNNCGYITEERYLESDEIMLKEGDILISKDGTLGKIGYVKGLTVPCTVASGIFVLRNIIPDVLDFDYLYHVLKSNVFKGFIARNKVLGSTIPHLYQRDLEGFELELPSIERQRDIAFVLNNIESKISNNNAIISELETMAKDIYDYWFVQFDFPDEHGKPYKSSGGKMVWNEKLKREIPDGWETTKVGDLATVKRGISYSASNLIGSGLPMVNLNSFTPSSTYKLSGIKTYNGAVGKDEWIEAYDLLMCTTQQTDIDRKTDIIGKTIIVPDIFDSRMVFSMDLVRIDTNKLLKAVIASETKTKWYNKYITGFATGTSILHLKLDGFLSYQIALPSDISILQRFNSMYMEWERRKSAAMKENEELSSLRDWLLPMLMNGQVKVG